MAMSRWQYKLVDTYRTSALTAEQAMVSLAEEIRDAGLDGWEAVGQLDVRISPADGHGGISGLLLFKKPLP
jgi:hypothetical protein